MYEHNLQKEIIEELKVSPSIDPKEEIRKTIDFLKDYMITQMNNGLVIKSYVLGLSGGQDSTLLGKLSQMAINELNEEAGEQRFQFVAVRLPYGEQKDEQDAQDAIQFIKPDKVITINIKKAVDASVEEIERATGEKLSNFLKGNEKARERMKAQYSLAGIYQGLVLGTDHAAEAVTGFYTKWGDGAADLAPLFRLTKSQGKEMLKQLNAPEHLYTKTPTADLEDDKPLLPDEVALGVTYEEIDSYLTGNKINPKSAEIIERHYTKTRHKRKSVITIFDDWWKRNK